MSDIIKFPMKIRDIFSSIDKERIIKGKVNEKKYQNYVNALNAINEYGEIVNRKIRISADDPRNTYSSHLIYIYFDTNTFEDEEVKLLCNILVNFDSIDFFIDEIGNVEILLQMCIYEEGT